ncbi:MAG: GAF domain-containing sensor histidine kinase [Anaerolineae bacterium]|nr:GAF domain-containing sensor histidine kinase [Anaerolineae bacterium]
MEANARVDYLEQKVRVLNRLAEISAVLNSTLELDALLGYLMNTAAEITDAEAASVLLWDEKTRELRFTATTTRQSALNLIGQSVPLEGSIAGTILAENRIVQVEDATADPRHYKETDEETQFKTRSVLGVPMTIKDRVVGVLEVLNKRQLPWTEEDRDYLSVLAAQAAVAIESAQLVAALQKANQELSELDKLKNDFIAIASHELRTPLAIILGYASFLQEEAEGKLSEHAAKVLASGLQLRRIIEELMNLRYLQQSAAELYLEPVPLDELVDDAVQEIIKLAEAKKHKLELTAPKDVIVQVDRIRTGIAISNLLNNAVRFTPEGGTINVKVESRGDEAWVTVVDSGIGIAADQIDRIFEKFYQVQDHMTRTHGGLGIGLSIARALVEAHGGRVWVESDGLGEGARFTLTLPVAT